MKQITFEQAAVMNIHYLFFPLEHFFKTMQALDVNKVDLWSGYPHFFVDEKYLEKARQIKRMSKDYSLDIVCFTPEQVRYPINMAALDKETKERTRNYLLRCLDAAAELESPMMQVVPGFGYYDGDKTPAFSCMCESLGILTDRAKELGITITLEPLQIIESNLVGSAEDAKRALQVVGADNLKIVVDTCHMAVKGESLQHYFDLLGDDIGHIHLNESDQVPWGQGNLPLWEYVNTLSNNDYKKLFTLEICSPIHHVDADKSVSDNIVYIRDFLNKQD